MKKLDIMNMRKNENWEIVNGKVQRVESQKIEGPVAKEGIKEVVEVEKINKVEEKKEDAQWNTTKKSKKKLK